MKSEVSSWIEQIQAQAYDCGYADGIGNRPKKDRRSTNLIRRASFPSLSRHTMEVAHEVVYREYQEQIKKLVEENLHLQRQLEEVTRTSPSSAEAELVALEDLVMRYQSELKYGIRAAFNVETFDQYQESSQLKSIHYHDLLYEHQYYHSNQWCHDEHTLTTPSGDSSSFDEINRIDQTRDQNGIQWKWTSPWKIHHDDQTDSNGWVYTPSIEAVAFYRQEQWCRKRLWTRERMIESIGSVSDRLNHRLQQQYRITCLDQMTALLRDQIVRQKQLTEEATKRLELYEQHFHQDKPRRSGALSLDHITSPTKQSEQLVRECQQQLDEAFQDILKHRRRSQSNV